MGGHPTHTRVPALDGLRGIAILLVVACHAYVPGLTRAGQTGVIVFFALSGYLITSQLLNTGHLELRQFWERRARRLLPAVLLLFAVLLPIYLAKGWSFTHYWSQVQPGLLYYANYAQIVGVNWPEPFGHLWSLAVEEQFYLLFPLLVLALRRNAHRLLLACTVLATTSAVFRLLLAIDPDTQQRSYFSVDTNAFALLGGAAIAAAATQGWRTKHPRSHLTIGAALVTACALYPEIRFTSALGVPAAAGALFLISGAIATRVRVLEVRPLRFAGRVSYGWYLWHTPLLCLTWRSAVPGYTIPKLAVCAVALGVAALSWRYVEQPILTWKRKPALPPADVPVTQTA